MTEVQLYLLCLGFCFFIRVFAFLFRLFAFFYYGFLFLFFRLYLSFFQAVSLFISGFCLKNYHICHKKRSFRYKNIKSLTLYKKPHKKITTNANLDKNCKLTKFIYIYFLNIETYINIHLRLLKKR